MSEVLVVVPVVFSEAEYRRLKHERALTGPGTAGAAVRKRMGLAGLARRGQPNIVKVSEVEYLNAQREASDSNAEAKPEPKIP